MRADLPGSSARIAGSAVVYSAHVAHAAHPRLRLRARLWLLVTTLLVAALHHSGGARLRGHEDGGEENAQHVDNAPEELSAGVRRGEEKALPRKWPDATTRKCRSHLGEEAESHSRALLHHLAYHNRQ